MPIKNLQELVFNAFKETVKGNYGLEINVSVKFENLTQASSTVYHHFPDIVYHPASLIKLFHVYLAKYRIQADAASLAQKHIQDPSLFGKKTYLDDIYDAIDASLRLSDNDALSLLMDFNSGTCSGPRLENIDFELFKKARNAVSDFFRAKNDYSRILNIPGKCFSFAPYGREIQLSLEEDGLGRNAITIDDATQIMHDIKKDYPELMQFMRRKIDNPNDEQCQFIAKGLIEFKDEIEIYVSKAGWTSRVRHDVAYIKLKSGQELILTIMTRGLSEFTELIPSIAKGFFKSCI